MIEPFRRVAIIGLGLIGGSIAKRIREGGCGIEVAALFRDDADQALAIQEGTIQRVFPSLCALIPEVDLVILATPLRSILDLAAQIAECAKSREEPLLLIDVGSCKRAIAARFEELSCPLLELIPTHPIAGSEKSGYSAAESHLFQGAPWIVTPHSKNSPSKLAKVEAFLSGLGGCVSYLSAQEHDLQTALISHLPGWIARHFYNFVTEEAVETLQIAGPGFHSFTRLAHDNPHMRAEIESQNHDLIESWLERWLAYLKRERV